MDLFTTAVEHLEDCSSFIGRCNTFAPSQSQILTDLDRLETDPPVLNAPQMVLSNANVLPALSMRTWKLPTQAKDLRYIS